MLKSFEAVIYNHHCNNIKIISKRVKFDAEIDVSATVQICACHIVNNNNN